ncbi:MAG: ABC transporter permease subunit [Anaerolineaceae bacterium]|nr:ABC transporter permease subunit [Anaerolineaceae bacterium]
MQKTFRWIAIIAIVLGVALPVIPQIIWSFAFRWLFPSLLPTEWSMSSWSYVFSPSSRVVEGFVNSLEIAVFVCILSILVGLPAARAIALNDFKGKGLIEWLLMVPIIVPGIVSTLGIHQLFIRLHLTNTFIGVSLVHLIPCIPYMVLVMISVFSNYGTELEDTARTLGAGPIRVFLNVTLPGIAPGLLVATMFTFLISWGQYITTVLIGGGTIITLPIVLFPFITGINYSNAAAISLVFVAPAILVLILTSRQLGQDSAVMGGFGRL